MQNSLYRFLVRILVERNLCENEAKYKNNILLFQTHPTKELEKLYDEVKIETLKFDKGFNKCLQPYLNKMMEVHKNCIELVKIGKQWDYQNHCQAFDLLDQDLQSYDIMLEKYSNKVTK